MTALPPDVVDDLKHENARLQAELRAGTDRQAASTEILRAIAATSGDAEQALQQIAGITARLFNCQSVRIRIAENGEWVRTIAVGASAERVGAEVSLAQARIGARNLPGTVVLENRQIHIPDLDNLDPAMADWPGLPHARAAGTRTMCGTPLRREGKAIGVLNVYRDQPTPFTADELALQQSFADQAVIAIENARLFNETREALERQTATADILKVIASSPSDTTPVFEAIATSAKRLLGGFSAAVFRFLDGSVHLAAFTPVNSAADTALKADFPRPVDEFEAFRLARQGKPFPIPDTEQIPHTPIREIARLHGFRSMLYVPLMKGSALVGIISVTRVEAGPFSPNHVQLLETLADQAVIAIENTRLFNETREALERQTATADILKVIASSPSDVQPVFEAIATSAKKLIAGFSAVVFRFVDSAAHVAAFTPTNLAADQLLKASFPRPVAEFPPFEQALAGGVVQVPDTEAEPDARMKQLARARGFRSALNAPLMSKETPLGLIVVTRENPGSFADHHVQLLQTFADQAVIAIENTRLFNETREALERQTATADILKVIASSPADVQPVFEAIATSANRLIGGFSSTVFRFIDGIAHLKAFTPTTPPADMVLQATFPRPVADFPPFQMAQAGEVTQITDTEALSDEILAISRARGFRSMLFAPLMNGGVSIGFIAVTRVQPGHFAEHHVQLLRTFADQAVIAIENARLFEEVQAKTSDLTEALTYQTGSGNILRVIASSPTDVRPVLKAIVESACELCEADDALVALKDGNDLLFQAQHGTIPVVWNRTPINRQAPSGRAVVDGKPVHVHDLISIEGEPFPDAREFARKTGVRTVLSVPMLRENEAIGAIVLRRTEVLPFSDKQISLLQTFANQAVIAIGNVRLFEEVQERTRELSQSIDELRTAQDRLVQTEKLASLGQLTAGIAHEIKNPLNFVNNFAALSAELTDELNDVLAPAMLTDNIREEVAELTGLLKDNLQKVVQHGKRADSIVKNMLLHSREGSGEHRPADINALLDESLNLAYHGARAEKPQFNVTLRRDFDAMAGMIELFPQEITRVLLNLISNGFYAVAKRKTENGDPAFEPMLSAATRNLGDTVEIRIRDNGTGIPAEVKEKMFNPFYTTKPAGEGTGLGLSMSHDIIVKQHGGRIDVETEPGEFTEFRIVLPRTSRLSDKE